MMTGQLRNHMAVLAILAASTGVGQRVAAQDSAQKPVTPAYVLLPGDQIEVKFFYNPELSEQQPIRPDGRIALQLVGDVEAAGLTPEALRNALRERYARVLREPDVTVIVKEISGRRVYVGGEVGTPGLLKMTASL